MKKLCLNDISILTNAHQNHSIKECARMIFDIKVILDDLWGHTLFKKNLCLHNIGNLLKFFKRLVVKQKTYCRKRLSKILGWP